MSVPPPIIDPPSPQPAVQAPPSGQLSPDGRSWWDGLKWVSAISPDGAWRWDGKQWVPVATNPPGTPALSADSPLNNNPYQYVTPGPTGATGVGLSVSSHLGWQFGGSAAWSIGFGAASILAPLLTSFYLPVLPLFGLWRAVIAIRSGRVIGAVIGIVLNVIGGLLSLLASGLIGG